MKVNDQEYEIRTYRDTPGRVDIVDKKTEILICSETSLQDALIAFGDARKQKEAYGNDDQPKN